MGGQKRKPIKDTSPTEIGFRADGRQGIVPCSGTFISWAGKISSLRRRDFSNMTTQNELHCTIPVHLLIRVAQEWLTTWGPHKVALGCEIPVLIFEKRKPVQMRGPYTHF